MQKLKFSICFLLCSLCSSYAQKGLFVKLSVGPGFTMECSNINSSSLSIMTKNHAIGWGITDNFAVQIGEFGGLNKQKVDNYNYINLDVFGVGCSYRMSQNIKISVLGGYSMVSFAKKWSESFGENGGNGIGANVSIDKEWFLTKRWGVRVGSQLFWITTTKTNYNFFNASINASVAFYLSGNEK